MVTSILDHYAKLQEVAELAARQFREAHLAAATQVIPEAIYPSPLPPSNGRHSPASLAPPRAPGT